MPNVLGQRDGLVLRPDIADIICTTNNRCLTSDSLLLQIFTVVELLFRDIKLKRNVLFLLSPCL